MSKLLLIDGSSLLSTSFFGSAPRAYLMAKTEEERENGLKKMLKTSEGQYTNGVLTMMKTLEKILKEQPITHLCVAWDISRNTFRRELYPEYKGTRSDTRPELKEQFGLAQEVLAAMNIKQVMADGYEADDLLGSFSHNLEEQIPTVVLTKDQDALQLVSNHTRLWLVSDKWETMHGEMGLTGKSTLPTKVVELTPEWVEHFYGVLPSQIPDLKGIAGDTSDNIPGVKGVGEKSILPLLQEFGTIEDLYDYLEETPVEEAKAFFKELGVARPPINNLMKTSVTELVGKEAALLSKKLATILTTIPGQALPTLSSLELNIDLAGKQEIYRKLEFKSLLS